jgi:hypothetical protein
MNIIVDHVLATKMNFAKGVSAVGVGVDHIARAAIASVKTAATWTKKKASEAYAEVDIVGFFREKRYGFNRETAAGAVVLAGGSYLLAMSPIGVAFSSMMESLTTMLSPLLSLYSGAIGTYLFMAQFAVEVLAESTLVRVGSIEHRCLWRIAQGLTFASVMRSWYDPRWANRAVNDSLRNRLREIIAGVFVSVIPDALSLLKPMLGKNSQTIPFGALVTLDYYFGTKNVGKIGGLLKGAFPSTHASHDAILGYTVLYSIAAIGLGGAVSKTYVAPFVENMLLSTFVYGDRDADGRGNVVNRALTPTDSDAVYTIDVRFAVIHKKKRVAAEYTRKYNIDTGNITLQSNVVQYWTREPSTDAWVRDGEEIAYDDVEGVTVTAPDDVTRGYGDAENYFVANPRALVATTLATIVNDVFAVSADAYTTSTSALLDPTYAKAMAMERKAFIDNEKRKLDGDINTLQKKIIRALTPYPLRFATLTAPEVDGLTKELAEERTENIKSIADMVKERLVQSVREHMQDVLAEFNNANKNTDVFVAVQNTVTNDLIALRDTRALRASLSKE